MMHRETVFDGLFDEENAKLSLEQPENFRFLATCQDCISIKAIRYSPRMVPYRYECERPNGPGWDVESYPDAMICDYFELR